ncbi:MAG: aldehyde dehydrogenase [Candidatus Poseidoniaceae archaeon]
MSEIKVMNYIGGEFCEASTGQRIEDIGPMDGKVIASIPRSSADDVFRAVQCAKSAQKNWAALTLEERANWLHKIADKMQENIEEIARLESLDTGKPWDVALNVDASRSVNNFRFFADFSKNIDELKFEMDDASNYVLRKPLGLVGLISPWNLPLYLLSWKIAPALLMGNAIIAKPSELTPLTAWYLCTILDQVGLPSGLVNILHGYGPEVGQAIVENQSIQGISFTGGTQTGKIVAATAAPMFKKLSLELGGKNATIVTDDIDIESVAKEVARASFLNSGQICLCGSRILIQSSIYEKFKEALIKAVSDFKIGPVISKEHKEKVLSYIDLAQQEGGTILTGGDLSESEGFYINPTLVEGLAIDSRCATEEIFGPVATIHSFDEDQDAIDYANITDYGLAGSVWCKDESRAKEIAEQIESGMIWINTWLHRDLRVPFGGVKASGVGREGGMWSVGFFSEAINICVKH